MSEPPLRPTRNSGERLYSWTRFWCERESTYALDESGFLADPEAFLGSSLNPNAQPLESWDERPCVVLLGEAGIGKSHELRRWHEISASASRQRAQQGTAPLSISRILTSRRSFESDFCKQTGATSGRLDRRRSNSPSMAWTRHPPALTASRRIS